MTLKKELLDILACPDTKEPVSIAEPELIKEINEKIARGELKNRGGNTVSEKMESGLLRDDRRVLYPIRDNIPIMLIDEGIPLEH